MPFHDRVRFRNAVEGRPDEQYVPIDWFVVDDGAPRGRPLPDNAMHRAPFPTIHLIRNRDLATLRMCDVSRVKRKNAVRLMKLGWEGVEKRLAAGGAGGGDSSSSDEEVDDAAEAGGGGDAAVS